MMLTLGVYLLVCAIIILCIMIAPISIKTAEKLNLLVHGDDEDGTFPPDSDIPEA